MLGIATPGGEERQFWELIIDHLVEDDGGPVRTGHAFFPTMSLNISYIHDFFDRFVRPFLFFLRRDQLAQGRVSVVLPQVRAKNALTHQVLLEGITLGRQDSSNCFV